MIAAPPGAAQVISVQRQAGAGRLDTSKGSHPLGALTYTGSSAGRGVLALQAGAGQIRLSGKDQEQIGPSNWRLKIDSLVLLAPRRVTGACDLVTAPERHTYVSLTCRTVGLDGQKLSVTWRGDGSPYRHVR